MSQQPSPNMVFDIYPVNNEPNFHEKEVPIVAAIGSLNGVTDVRFVAPNTIVVYYSGPRFEFDVKERLYELVRIMTTT